MPSRKDTVRDLLEEHGRTYADELGIRLSTGSPSALFRWLIAANLFSARIGAAQAVKAAKALAEAGWTTPEKMRRTTWEERVRVLNHNGYARYDESTASTLGQNVELLISEYGGDLRKLREAAGRDPAEERTLLKAFKGMGEMGVDIFMREAQTPWTELYPFADRKALAAAKRLGLGDDARALARLVPQKDFPRLIAALVRSELAHSRGAGRRTKSAGRRTKSKAREMA
jgi:hypothetical protein